MSEPQEPIEFEGQVRILNVGTRILLKDVMDAYLRSFGDFRTHYARDMASALRIFTESQVNIVISEIELIDGSAFRLMRELGGTGSADDELYFIVALEERSEALMALANEIEADAVLVKPFSSADLYKVMSRYNECRVLPKEPWKMLVREALIAFREKRFSDVDSLYAEAIHAAPESPAPLCKAAQYYLVKPDFGIAENFLQRAIALRPNYVPALSALGSLYLAQHSLDRAFEYFSKAHAISPLNPERSFELVRLYVERGLESCRSLIRIDPSNSAAKLMLAKLLTVQKDYAGAVREIEKVMPALRDASRNEAQTFAALARKLGGIAK